MPAFLKLCSLRQSVDPPSGQALASVVVVEWVAKGRLLSVYKLGHGEAQLLTTIVDLVYDAFHRPGEAGVGFVRWRCARRIVWVVELW